MRKERNKSQIGKRIMAFVLTLLLMNSTIAYLIPTQEVKAGADYNITSKGLLGGYYDNTPTDYSNQIDETFTWHSASYNPEGAPDTVPKTATLTYYTAETDYDLLPELGPVIAEPTNSENSGAASEGAAPVYAGEYIVRVTVAASEGYNETTKDFYYRILAANPEISNIQFTGPNPIYDTTQEIDVTYTASVNGHSDEITGTLYTDGKLTPGTKTYTNMTIASKSSTRIEKNYSYGNTDVTITAIADTVTSISVNTDDYNTTYNYKEAFNPNGLTLIRNYLSGYSSNENAASVEGVQYSTNVPGVPADSLTCDVTEITVNYKGKTASFPITVNPIEVDWNTQNATVVLEGEEEGYYYTGNEIKPVVTGITYNDASDPSTSHTIDPSAFNVSYSNNINAGNAQVIITAKENGYCSINGTQNFTINPKEVSVSSGTYKLSKEYDGANTAGTPSGELSISGILSKDNQVQVQLGLPTEDNSEFWSGDVDDDKLGYNIELTGEGKNNYALAEATVNIPAYVTPVDIAYSVADPEAVVANGAYGDKLSELVVSGISAIKTKDSSTVSGTWKLDYVGKANIIPEIGHTGTYKATFKANSNPENYKKLTYDNVKVNIAKKTGAELDVVLGGKYEVSTEHSGKVCFVINPIIFEGGSVEYSIDNTNNWQDSNIFDDLEPTGSHTFQARVKEDANYEAGIQKSEEFTFRGVERTDEPTFKYTITDSDSKRLITIEPVDGAEYIFENVWGDSNTKAYAPGANKYIGIRYKATNIYSASNGMGIYVNTSLEPQDFDITVDNEPAEVGEIFNKTYGDSFSVGATGFQGDATVGYGSYNQEVATVDANGNVTIIGAGEAKIEVTVQASATHNSATKHIFLHVAKRDLVITIEDEQTYTTVTPTLSRLEETNTGLVNGDILKLVFGYEGLDVWEEEVEYPIGEYTKYINYYEAWEGVGNENAYNIIFEPKTLTVILDTTELQSAIDTALGRKAEFSVYPDGTEESEVPSGTKYVTKSVSDALDAALATAYDVMENATTAGEIKKCKDALTKAIKGFYADRKTGTKQGGNSGSGSGSSGTGSGYTQTEPTPEAKVVDNSAVYEPKVVVGDDGVGSVSINSDTLDALLDSMGDSLSGSNGGSSTGALGGSGQDTIDTLVIDTNNSTSTDNADGISFTMEGKALNRLSSETDLNLSIESLNASLFLPSEILDDLSEKTKNMQLNVNIQKGLEEEVPEALLQEAKFEFAAAAKVGLKTGKEKVTQFGDHQAIVSIPVTNSGNMPRNPVIIAISDDGRTDYLEGTYDGRLVRVPTTHLTTFVVTTMAYEEFAKDLGFITFNDDYVTLYVGGNTGKTLLPYTFTDDVRVVAKDAKVKKGTKPVIRMSAYISDGDSDVLTVGKKGKLTAKKEGKVVVTYEYVNEKGEKRSHIIYVTVEKASIKFTKSLKKLTEGSMKTYKIALFGYKPESITWSTIKKKKAVVGRNEGKLVARVYAVTAGKDTLFVKVDGKKLKKLNIEVVGK